MTFKIIIKELATPEEQKFCIEQKQNKNGVLLNVSLQQQMYKPSCLEVTLHSKKEIADFKGKLVTLTDMKSSSTIYANNYFIINVRKKGEEITLRAYSADYFLTIDKYSQAFTAKTLVEGIVNPTLEKTQSRNFEYFRSLASFTTDSEKYAVDNLANFADDKIIPYSVQYNESFYDYLVRMCSRDGEFLYMDSENKLCVGLAPQNKVNTYLETKDIEFIDAFEEVEDSLWEDKNYLSENSAKFKNTTKGDESANKIYSFNGVYSPEYFEKIEKDEFCNRDDFSSTFGHVSTAVRSLLLQKTVNEALILTAHNTALAEGSNLISIKDANDEFKEKYPRGPLYSSANIKRDSKGYKELYEYQVKSAAGQARVEKTNAPKVKLGEIVGEKGKENGEKFVVYELKINSIFTKSKGYEHSHELLLIKQVEDKFYPLPMLEKRVRKSSAQRAVVIDNYDPERMGRVRILYPWQSVFSNKEYLEEIKKETNSQDETEVKQTNNIHNKKNASPWIRVSYPMASDGAGFMFTPAKGDEVLIDYEDGNVEKPYVCGAFYNNANMPSSAAQTNDPGKVKSISSANGHHISFTDGGGAHKLVANMFPLIKTLGSFGVGWDKFDSPENKYYGGGFEISDKYGIYAIKGSTHGRSIDVLSPFGNIKLDAFSGITINAPSGDVKIVGKNVTIEARNNLKIESGTNIKNCFANDTKDGFWSMMGEFAKSGVNTYAEAIVGQLDLSFVRTCLEVFLRPIGGTMLIKSNRYMRLEAGEGTTYPYNWRAREGQGFGTRFGNGLINYNYKTKLQYFKEDFTSYFNRYDKIYARLNDLLVKYKEIGLLENVDFFKANGDLKTDVEMQYPNNEEQKVKLSSLRIELENVYSDYNRLLTKQIIMNGISYEDLSNMLRRLWANFKANLDVTVNNIRCEYTLRRPVVLFNYLKTYVSNDEELNKYLEINGNNADDYSAEIKTPDESGTKQSWLKKSLISLGKKAFDIGGIMQLYDDKVWSTKDKGAIFFSDTKDAFYRMGDDGSFVKGWGFDYKREADAMMQEAAKKDAEMNILP